MIIKVDIDGVIGDNLGLFINYIKDKYSHTYTKKEFTEYNPSFDKLNGKNLRQLISEMYDEDPEYLKNMKLKDQAKEKIEKLSNDNTIKIVTHRPDLVSDITIEWLNEKDIYYDEIIVDAPSDKSQINGDVMIDDNLEILTKYDKSRNPILFPTYYNLNSSVPENVHHPGNMEKSLLENKKHWSSIYNIIKELQE